MAATILIRTCCQSIPVETPLLRQLRRLLLQPQTVLVVRFFLLLFQLGLCTLLLMFCHCICLCFFLSAGIGGAVKQFLGKKLSPKMGRKGSGDNAAGSTTSPTAAASNGSTAGGMLTPAAAASASNTTGGTFPALQSRTMILQFSMYFLLTLLYFNYGTLSLQVVSSFRILESSDLKPFTGDELILLCSCAGLTIHTMK